MTTSKPSISHSEGDQVNQSKPFSSHRESTKVPLLRFLSGQNNPFSPLRDPNDYAHLDDDNQSLRSVPHSSSSSDHSTQSWITDFNLLHEDPELSMNEFLNMSGGPSAATTLTAMLHYAFVAHFPVVKELTNLYMYQPTTGRRFNTTIPEVVADLNPHLLQAILAVTYETGPAARDKLFTAFNLFRNRTTTHRSLIIA